MIKESGSKSGTPDRRKRTVLQDKVAISRKSSGISKC